MSGIGRQMAAAQARYDAMEPPEFYADDSDDEISAMRVAIEEAEALIGRAERALNTGDTAAASDLLIEAGGVLGNHKEEA